MYRVTEPRSKLDYGVNSRVLLAEDITDKNFSFFIFNFCIAIFFLLHFL